MKGNNNDGFLIKIPEQEMFLDCNDMEALLTYISRRFPDIFSDLEEKKENLDFEKMLSSYLLMLGQLALDRLWEQYRKEDIEEMQVINDTLEARETFAKFNEILMGLETPITEQEVDAGLGLAQMENNKNFANRMTAYAEKLKK